MKNVLKKLVFITLGCAIAAFAIECFLLPNKIIDGGIVGISMMANILTQKPLAIFLVVLNFPFILLAFKKFGKAFIVQTFYAIITFGIFTFLGHHYFKAATDDLLLSAIFGGIFLGLGVGLVLRNNASLDGTEILAIRFNQKTVFSVGEIIMFFNVFIFACAGFLLGWDRAMYSALTYYTAYKVIDMVLQGFEESKSIFIVSDKGTQIGDLVMNQMGRGVTYINAEGGYTGISKKMLYCVINRFEIMKIKEIVSQIDEDAFIAIEDVHEVAGKSYRKSDHG